MTDNRFLITHTGKRFLLFCISLITLYFVPFTYAQSGFEGTLTYVIQTEQGQTQTMEYSVKGKKVRMDMDIPGVPASMKPAIIFDNETNTMYTVISQLKSYMAIPMDSLTDKSSKYDDSEKPVKTGKTKMIAGVKCEEWKIQNDKEETILWNAPHFGNFIFGKGSGFFGGDRPPDWASELIKNGFFPFQIISKDPDGSVVMTMEVTHVDRKKLDASLFKVPSDYNKMNMPLMQH